MASSVIGSHVKYLRSAAALSLCFFFAYFQPGEVHAESSVVITEIVGSNSTILDEEGDSPDWIEIHNQTGKEVNLKGWGLSDKPDNLHRWVFPNRVMSPGEYLVVFASGKDKSAPKGPLHTNFKLSEKDEGVYLSDENGELRDSIFIKKLSRNVSFGEHPFTGKMVYFPEATPGKGNTTAAFSPVVKYSVKGGFYSSPVSVRLYEEGRDATIYYTTDGTTPSVASKVYSGPIRIDRNTTIRAVSLLEGHLPSPPSGQTYFIDFDNRGMPVLSIATEKDKLWNEETGLLRKVTHKDYMLRESVRVHVSYFDENGEMAFSQDAVIGVVGASSREVMMRPIKISANTAVDPLNGMFKYRLLKKDIDEYRHFQIRNNNQDGIRYLDDEECMPTMGMRNALFCDIVRGQEGIEVRDDCGPVLFFINGKNYGMMNIGEKRDNTSISANNPSVRSGDIDLVVVRNDMGLRVERGQLGEGAVHIRHDAKVVYKGYFEDGAVEYEEISSSAKRSGSTSGVDDFISLDPTDSSQLDPKSFIASMAAHIIACNTDFGMNNIGFWREAPMGEKPGPFRTYSFDFDSIFGLDMWREDYDTLAVYMEDTKLFPEFMQKEEYRQAFIRKIDDFLNGPFSPENALPIIDRLEKKMEPWIEYHLDIWADGKMDKKRWKENVESLRNYIKVRPKYVRMFVRDHFGVSGYSKMKFSSIPADGGGIYMDAGVYDIALDGEGEYADVPMTVRAVASKGYKFSHFDIDGDIVNKMTCTITPKDGMTVKAMFLENPGAAAEIVINEVVRSGALKMPDEDGEKQDWIELHNTTGDKLDIGGMYLSDNPEKLTKWRFPDVTVNPGGFLIVYASGKDRNDPERVLHTSFKLSAEPVILVDRDGQTIVDIMTREETARIPKHWAGVRCPDGSSIFEVSETATPGRPNF